MRSSKHSFGVSFFGSALLLFSAYTASAANGFWSGAQSAYWTNSANWSASPYPSGVGETALFTGSGNDQTNVDLTGFLYIRNIRFDTSSAAAYTIGAGAAGSQTLVLADSGEITLSSTVGNSQTFNCGVQLGGDRTAQSYTLRNDTLLQTLSFADIFGCPIENGGAAGNKTLTVLGNGPIQFNSLRPVGAAGLVLTSYSTSTLTLAGSNTLAQINFNGGSGNTFDIGDKELYLNQGNPLNCNQDTVINGSGNLRLSTTDTALNGGYNYADLFVAAGRTVTINPSITGLGGIEIWSGAGSFVFNGTNTFLGHVCFGTSSSLFVQRIGNRGSLTSNLGQGTNLTFNSTGRLVYTGTGESSDRIVVLNSDAKIDQSGPSGKLAFTATPTILGANRTMTLQGSTAGIGEFSAPLANVGAYSLGVTKAGSGTWTLSGTNTYTGNTAINGGKLLVNSPGGLLGAGSAVTVNYGAVLGGTGKLNGSVTVATGGTLAPGDINTVGTLSLNSTLTMTSASLLFDLTTPDGLSAVTDKVSVASTVTVNGTNTITVSFPNGSAPAGSYTLMTFPFRTGSGYFVLSPAYPNVSLFTNATMVRLDVAPGGAKSLLWGGDASSSWDGADLNWRTNGTALAFTPGDPVAFDDTAAQFAVDSSAPVAPSSVIFNNSLSNYIVSASITGTGAVYKLGSAEVTLTGNSPFTNTVTIASGLFRIGAGGMLGAGNFGPSIINNGELVYASSIAQTNSGLISGSGNLTACGSSPLTLLGTNSFGGLTLVTNGTLRIGSASALGGTATGTIVARSGTLELAAMPTGILYAAEALELRGKLSCLNPGTNAYPAAISLYNGAELNVGAGSTLFVSIGTPNIGSNTVSKTGAGTLRFTGDPDHRSVFVVAEGTVELQHSGTTDAPFLVSPGATLRQFNANDIGPYLVQADGTLDMLTSGNIGGLSGVGLVTNSGAVAITLTVGNSGLSGDFSGVIRNGAGAATVALSKTSTGIQTLSGANTHSGGTSASGGTLNINNASALGTGTLTINGGNIDNSSAASLTLTPNNAQAWNNDFTFIGSKSLNLGAGAVTMGGGRTVTVLTNTLSVGGVISGSGFGLTKSGAGMLVLSGANTYSGATAVNGGALIVNSPGSLASGSAVTVNTGATFGGSGTVNGVMTAATNSLLAPGGLGAVGTLTVASASATALELKGALLTFDLATVADVGVCDRIALTGAGSKVALTGVNRIALNFPTNGIPAGTYTLISSIAGITTNAGASVTLLTTYPNATLSQGENSIELTVTDTGIAGALWNGAYSGSWDGSDLNWLVGGSEAVYPAGAATIFDDTAAANSVVSSSGAVSPATLLFNNTTNDYTVAAQLEGTGPLTKQGSAGITLSGMTAYNPAVIAVNNGTLTFGGASQLNSGAYAGDIFNDGTLTFASSAAQTYSGMISGYGALTKYGNGTLTFAGSNLYSGATLVNAGILKIQHAYGLGLTTAGTTVNPGGTLELAGGINTLAEALALNGTLSSQSGSNTFNGVVTLTSGSRIDVGTGSTLVLTNSGSSCIQANGPFVKTGGGRLALTKDPNGNGQMTVREGFVDITAGTMDANVVINSGAYLSTVTDALNDNSTRVQVDAGGTYAVRGNDVIAGLAGAGLVTRDISGTTTLTIGNNSLPETFSGVITNGAGTMALTKTGTGVQILSGKNTYTGATILQNSGALYIVSPGSLGNTVVTVSNTGTILGGNGSIQGGVTLQGYNILSPGVSNNVGTLTLGSTLSMTTSTLLCDISASPAEASDRVTVAGALTLNGSNVVSLSFAAGTAAAGDYTLMTFASKTGTGAFQLAGSYPNASLVLSNTNLLLRVSGSGTSSLTWNGNVSASWDGSDANWLLGSAPATFADGSAVAFNDAASSFNVTSLGDVTPSALVFNNAVNIYSVAANIKGTAPLNKFGLAATYLTGTSSYNPSSVIIANGWVYLNQNAQLNGGVYSGNLVVNGGGLSYGSTPNQTLNGVISGSGGLIKSGPGALTLANTNTISGTVTIYGGTLYARGCAQAMGTAPLTLGGGTLELDHDAGLTFVNNASMTVSTTVKSGRLTSGPGVTNTLGTLSIGNQTFTAAAGLNVAPHTPYGLKFGNTTISGSTPTFDVANNGTGIGYLSLGVLSGNYHLNKANSGTLYFGSASTRSGGTNTVTAGTLKLGNPTALGTSGASLAITLNGGTLDLATDTTVTNYPTAVGGATTILSDKATPNSDGITHILGNLTINNSLSVAAGANVKAGTPFGLTFGTNTLTGNATFDVAAYGTLTLGSASGNYGLTKAGYGTLVLASPNAYTGMTTITRGLVIITGANGSISNTSAITLSGDSTLELRNSTATNWTDRVRNGIPLTLAGGTLSFAHAGGTAHYTEALGVLSITANTNQFVTSQANVGYTSVVTLASIARTNAAVLNFAGAGLGDSDRNRIFITGQAEGNLGPWATVNGTNFAFYSTARGVCTTTNTYDLAARGPGSVIPSDSNLVARINSPGIAGPITLAGNLTNQIFAVRQNTGTDAVISTLSGTTNKILQAYGLFITDGQGSVTVGEKVGDGFLSSLIASEGLLLDVDGTSGILTLNAPIVDVGGAVAVKKYGSGKVILSGSDTYTGATTVYEGTLSVQNANALGGTVTGTTVNSNAVLEVAGSITTATEAMALYGTLSSQTGVNTYAGAITILNGSMIDVGSPSLLIVSGSTAGSGILSKTGGGTMRITADPNSSGLYVINSGTLELNHGGTTDAIISIGPGATLRELTANDLNDSMSITNNGVFDMRTSDTMGMLVGNGRVTVGTGVSATLAIGNESSKIATFSGVIENGFGIMNLQKNGAGTQILTGTNTYTGTTVLNERSGILLVNSPGSLQGTVSVTVNSGTTLGGNGSIMSPVTVVAGGCLLPADSGVIGTLTLGSSLTLNGTTLYYDIPAALSASDLINVSGVLTVNGMNTIALSFPGGVAPAGDYTLMNFASRAGAGTFAVRGLNSTPNATLELTATSLILHVSSGTGFGLTWNGNLSSVWDGGYLNWKVGTAPASYTDGSIVTFDDTALANYTVTSVGYGVTPSAIYINNNTNSYSINAALVGTAPLVKSGWGIAYLNNSLNYNPDSITVNPVGTLYIGNAANAQLNNGVYNNPIFVNGGQFRFESGAALTLNSLITGGGSLAKYGTGTITLNGTNSFRGGTTHGTGVMNINNGGTDATASAIGIGRFYIGGGAVLDNTSGADITLATSNPNDWNGDFTFAGSSSLNFGTADTRLSANRIVTVLTNTLTVGYIVHNGSGPYSLTKAGAGALVIAGTGTSGYSGGTTLSGGTLYAQRSGSVLGSGGLTLSGAGIVLEYDNDIGLTFNNGATVSASLTIKSGRLTYGPGVTHTLGTLSINASTLSIAPGTNALVNTPYGLTYGTTTLTAGPAVFNVANNGGAAGTLTLGAVGGNYALAKKGAGLLRLATVSLLGGPVAINNGRILAVTGGSCSNSSVTVQASDVADAAASLNILYSAANTQWTCSNLVTAVSVAPAASRPALDFSFAALPSTTVAPFRVRDTVTFATNPIVNVYMGNLTVPTNAYPLMVVGVSAPTTVIPTLNMVGGYTNSFLYWNGNTLMLRLYASGVPLKWTPGVTGSGTWDINNSANLVWTNSATMAYAYYQEPFGSGASGDNVLFDDSTLTGPSTVTVSGAPSPSSVVMTNNLYAYTFTGSGVIAGAGTFSKYGTNRLTLATANTYTGATTFASGIVDIPAGAGLNVGNTANAGVVSVGSLSGKAVFNINGGTVNASKSSSPALQVGTTSGAIGVVNLTAGVLNTGSEIFLGAGGNGQNGFGALNVTGGSVTSASYLAIGRASVSPGNNRGELLVSGGTVTVNSQNLEIGSSGNAVGISSVATLTGGTVTTASGAGDVRVGNRSHGILNVSGSAALNVLNPAYSLRFGYDTAGVIGIANLNGGNVTVPAVTQSSSASGYLNFNGGTLKANKNNTAFMTGLTAARIYADGATIDDGGYAIAIAQSLLSPVTGNGVSLAGMTFSGTGFIAPPIVDIAGVGNGASAIATIDASGNLTGVTLTSPGANYYMGTPTLTFTGGGGTVTQTGSASTAPNTSGGLTKIGAGTLTLTGTNSFSGATVVNNGRLALATGASCSNSAVTVQSSGSGAQAIFGVRYPGVGVQSAIAGLTTSAGISGGSVPDLEFAFAAVPSATTAPLVVTGDAAFTATTDVRVILTGLTVPNGSYPLMTVGGTVPSTLPTLTVAGGYAGSTLSWSGNTLMLNLAGSAGAIKWGTGAFGSGTWNVNDSTNLVWKDGASAPTYYQETLGSVGDQVVFDDAFIGLNNAVALNTTVTPSGVEASNATFAYALSGSGAIAGTNAFVKSGAANFRLNLANTYSGGTLINVGGVLQLSNAGGLGTGGVTNNGTLNLDAGAGGTGDINYTGLNNSLSGAGTNNISLGTGIQRMQLLGNYSGFVGVWNIGIGAFAGASRAEMTNLDNAAATVNVLTNGTLWVSVAGTHYATAYLYGGDTGESYGQLRLDSGLWAGPVVLSGLITGSGDGYLGSEGANGEISGTISEMNGPYEVSKVGSKTLTLSGNNTYLGPTVVKAGALRVATLGNVGSGPGPLGAPTTVAQGTVKLGSGGTAATLVYAGMGETSDRIIDMAGTTGGATVDQSGTNLLTLTGGLTYSGIGAKTLTFQGSTIGTGEFAGVISNTPYGNAISVVKSGTGTWKLSNANTYTGGTQIKGGGTLVITHPNALGTNTVLFPNEVGGLDLAHDGVGETPYEILMQAGAVGTIKSNCGAAGEGINHNLGFWHLSGVTVYVTNGANVVSGTASITAAYLDLYSGSPATTILAPTTADLVISGGVSILGSAFPKTLQLDGTSQGSSIRGPITNGLGNVVTLTKSNASTWTLYGSNTFSGTKTISGGALVLAGTNGAFAGSGAITISGNALFELRNNDQTNSADRVLDASGITLSGGTLRFAHTGGAADYSERMGALSVTASSNTFATSQADIGRTSAVTIASLTVTAGATLDFTGVGLGQSDQNRIFITTGQANGPIGAWATVNGTNIAAYSSTLGVYAFGSSGSDVVTNLAARGEVPNSVVPDNANAFAQITEAGVSGPITLEGIWTNRIFMVQQSQSVAATIDTVSYTTNKTLLASALTIAADQGSLTLGANPGNGYVAPLTPGGSLKLENNNAASLLTVNAAVANNTSASTVNKFGPGTVALAGSNTFSGAVTINEGTLDFGGPFAQRLSNVIGGAGSLAKSGTNQLHILGVNTYSGPSYIQQGIVRANENATFGSTNSPVYITDGGTLNIGSTPDVGGTRAVNAINFGNKQFIVSGSGYLGQGAINNTSTAMQYNAFSRISLAGDTTFGANQRWDMNNNAPYSSLDLNDYTLTKTGALEVAIHGVQVNPGAGNAGKIVVNQGLFRFETGTSVNGTTNNAVTVNRGGTLDLWQLTGSSPSLWSIILNEGAVFNGSGGLNVTNQNVWNGPVTLNGRAFINCGSAPSHLTVNGDITGAGSLVKQGGATVTLWLNSTNNTYSGDTLISNGTLFARAPGSLPGYNSSKVTIAPAATLAIRSDDGVTGWNAQQIKSLHDTSTFGNNTAVLSLDTTSSDLEYTGDLTKALALTKRGNNTLTLNGTNTFTGSLIVNGGTLVLPSSSTNAPGLITVSGGSTNTSLIIDGVTTIGTNTTHVVTVASASGDRSIATLSTNATFGKLLLGNVGGSSGAFIQKNGILAVGPTIGSTEVLNLGNGGGYGYYRMNNGSLTTGQLGLGGGGNGVFDLYNGTVNVPTSNGWLIFNWGTGISILNMFGGSVTAPPGANDTTLSYAGNSANLSVINMLGVGALLDTTPTGRMLNMARSAGSYLAAINLNSGTIRANKVYAQVTGTPTVFGFNGGMLQAGSSSMTFMQGLTASLVYPGGAVIDSSNATVTVGQSLLAPTGYGVTYIPVLTGGTNYIGAPAVKITGGSGLGATAIATVDLDDGSPTKGQVTGILITSSGVGYQWYDVPVATLVGGGATTPATVGFCQLALNTSVGGLTKLGSGTLTLAGTNTYGGTTLINSGTLRLGLPNAIPTNAAVVVNGGTYDLGGFNGVITNRSVTLYSGSVSNGTLNTSLTKVGPDSATLSAAQDAAQPVVVSGGTLTLAPVMRSLIAGLYEGRSALSNFDLASPNPQFAVKLSVTNAYLTFGSSGASGGVWLDNSTYIYSGYIWNSSATNENWTFNKSFDDGGQIKIDGTAIISDNLYSNLIISTVSMTPGPHAIEVRLGQGGGGVGPNGGYPGIGVDRMGRNTKNAAFFQRLQDPGDGSFLTLSALGRDDLLNSNSMVEVDTNATLNLGGTTQTVAQISGSGTVSNGTLAVTDVIAPGGTNVIGTLTFAASTTASGTLLVDLDETGNSDRLAVQGNLNMSGMTLQIANPDKLNTGKAYTIVTCTGTRTGTFGSNNLPGTHWKIVYYPNGTVKLIYQTGTLIRVK